MKGPSALDRRDDPSSTSPASIAAGPLSRRGFLQGTVVGGAGAAVLVHSPPAAAETAAAGKDLVAVATTVNGRAQAVSVGADESTVELVRDRLGLTGTKLSCGAGTCGACTVLVDGESHCACLLPAVALEGRSLTTIEGIATGTLHPVQRAFMAEDALQCGFCTPGFIVEASAFHDRWRAAHGTQEPSLDEVAQALAGHLCRCGAYPAIYAAVQAACRGAHDQGDPLPARVEAREKVTGAARYTVDVKLEGMLHARVLRSPHAHAVLKGLDSTAAMALPGVIALHRMLPDGGRARYADQEVAAVAAVDERSAAAAVAALVADWEVHAHVLDMDAARAEGAPLVYADKAASKEAPVASEGGATPAKWAGNVRGPSRSDQLGKPGGADRRIDSAQAEGRVVSGSFRTQGQTHNPLEPHAVVARWIDPPADLPRGEIPRARLELWAGTQGVVDLAHDAAERFGLRAIDVKVSAEHVGGAFGSKVGLQPEMIAAIELSRQSKRPVRLVLERWEEQAVGGYRPGHAFQVELAHGPLGELLAVRTEGWGDSGVSVGVNTGMIARLLYPEDHKRLVDYDVATHAPPARPFRGPGGPPVIFALEQVVDELALKLGQDPLSLRRAWDGHEPRKRLYDWIAKQPGWAERGGDKGTGRYRTGIGVAAGSWFTFIQRNTQVQLDASKDGLVASSACQDMGNGARTVVAAAIAERMRVRPDEVTVRLGHSEDVVGPMSAGSRTAASLGPAATAAAENLLLALARAAEDQLGWQDVEAVPGGLKSSAGDKRWEEVIAQVGPLRAVGQRARDPEGYFLPFAVAGLSVGKSLGGAVQMSRVEVDTWTGQVRVTDVWIGMGVGKVRVPAGARSQVQGGIVQGIGYALYEERRMDPLSGQVLTRGLDDYRMPGIGDTPRIHIEFDEAGFEGMLGEGVGLGELCTLPCAASVANAVRDAIGWRPTQLPIRPDRVLEVLS